MNINALPAITDCPICKGENRLHIYRDKAIGGEWCYCDNCTTSCDIITLAARTWKLGIDGTVRKLIINNVIHEDRSTLDKVDTYKDYHMARREIIQDFWQQSQENHMKADTAAIRMLQRNFRVYVDGNVSGERLIRFVGSSCTDEIAKNFERGKYEYWMTADHKRSGSYPHDEFPGRNWKDLLVVPFYDLPGRICGFLCIGREGKECDFVYRKVLTGVNIKEAGLGMLHALFQQKHPQLENTKFIVTDPTIALYLQGRQTRESSKMLPLACTYEDQKVITQSVWEWLRPQDTVFWGPCLIKTIKQAMRANGKVSVSHNYTTDYILKNVSRYSALEWLRRFKQTAVHWSRALQDMLHEETDLRIEEIMTGLGLQGRELHEFIASCDDSLQDRLKYMGKRSGLANKIRFETKWVIERDSGWYLERTNECISDAVFRVQQIISSQSGSTYYQGEIQFRGKSYPFTEKTDIIDKEGALKWMHQYLRDTLKVGATTYYPSWNGKSVQLSLAMHPPTTTQRETRIGWVPDRMVFQLPAFSLSQSGVTAENITNLFPIKELPGVQLPMPGMIPKAYVRNLSDVNPETQIVWAVVGCVLANIIAPAVNRNQLPIILSGRDAQEIGRSAAQRLGCPMTTCMVVQTICEKLMEHRDIHDWPWIIKNKKWHDEFNKQNVVCSLNYVTARILNIRGKTNMVASNQLIGSLQLTAEALPYVLVNYLAYLVQRKLFLPESADQFVNNILLDLAEWFGEIGGNKAAIRNAMRVLRAPSEKSATNSFFDIVFYLYQKGKLNFEQAGFTEDFKQVDILATETNEGKMIWIAKDRFSVAARKVSGLSPDILLITAALQKTNALHKEFVIHNRKGWLIAERTWNKKIQLWRKK